LCRQEIEGVEQKLVTPAQAHSVVKRQAQFAGIWLSDNTRRLKNMVNKSPVNSNFTLLIARFDSAA
jgi:hypothetical protein